MGPTLYRPINGNHTSFTRIFYAQPSRIYLLREAHCSVKPRRQNSMAWLVHNLWAFLHWNPMPSQPAKLFVQFRLSATSSGYIAHGWNTGVGHA